MRDHELSVSTGMDLTQTTQLNIISAQSYSAEQAPLTAALAPELHVPIEREWIFYGDQGADPQERENKRMPQTPTQGIQFRCRNTYFQSF